LRIDETQAIPVMAIIVETIEELSHFKSIKVIRVW
jgi:hypothetical protein